MFFFSVGRKNTRHSHRKPLHLPPTQRRLRLVLDLRRFAEGTKPDGSPSPRLSAFSHIRVLVADRALKVRIESVWELVDELVRAGESRGGPGAVVVFFFV